MISIMFLFSIAKYIFNIYSKNACCHEQQAFLLASVLPDMHDSFDIKGCLAYG